MCMWILYPLCIFPYVLVTYVLDQIEEEHVAQDGVFPSTVHVADATGVDAEWRRDLSYVVASVRIFWIIIV